MKKIFPIIGEFSLMVLLLLVLSASFISVLSLSPVSFEQVQGEKQNDSEVAGEFTGEVIVESPVSFIPSLATEKISFGDQKIDSYSYSTEIIIDNLEKGENSIDIVRIINLQKQGQFQVDINMNQEDLENIEVSALVGEKRVELTDGLFEGKVFPYRFQLEKNDQSFIQLILTAKEKINYPVKITFSLKGI